MSGADETRWDCLPHDPESFFGLNQGFDRKDLKRAYNALIRRFKPERFPAEFQRIRAAYELLDGQLRYGQRPAIVHADRYEWQSEAAPARRPGETPARETRAPAPAAAALLEELPPAEAYAQLQRRGPKTPYDFYRLAVLSDVAADEPLQFLKWLLLGLRANPGDQGLLALLYEYLQTEVPDGALAKVLRAVAKVVPGDRFYFLTEKLWERLLRTAPFDTFRATLERCEENRVDYHVSGKLVFTIRLLRSAIWKADDAWLQGAFGFLDDHQQEVPPGLDYEFEFLYWLKDYRDAAPRLLDGNPVRQRIHEALCDYCTLEERDADTRFVAAQVAIAGDAEGLLAALPPGQTELAPLLQLWYAITDEVAGRVELVEQHDDDEQLFHRLVGFMSRIEADERGTYWQHAGLLRMLLSLLMHLGLVGGPFVLAGRFLGYAGVLPACVVAAVVGLVVYHAWFSRAVIDRWHEGYLHKRMAEKYRRRWRADTAGFLAATHMPFETLRYFTAALAAEQPDALGAALWLAPFVAEDDALALYALSVRFPR